MPALLLADSEPFFRPALRGILRAHLGDRAAQGDAWYVGASNGDDPAFAELGCAALRELGCPRPRVVAPDDADAPLHLARARVILLSGGDPSSGWALLSGRGLVAPLRAAASAGALLVGVSAGAMQLGLFLGTDRAPALGVVPYFVAAHEEPGWPTLHAALDRQGAALPAPALIGLGIPRRGVVAVSAEGVVEELSGTAFWRTLNDLARAA